MLSLLRNSSIALLLLSNIAAAQNIDPPPASNSGSSPCSSFGTASGQCAQGGVITAGGPTGSATVAPIITYNAAGQLTTVNSATITPAIGSITGLGTGVGTALGVNVGSAGAPLVNGGALGTPSSGNLANTTGYPAAALPAATISTQGAVVSGCAAYTPTDLSGATLTFGTPTGEYCINGPAGGQIVTVFFSVTYPTTADASAAKISLPIAVPNVAVAVVKGTSGISSTSVNATPRTVLGSNPGAVTFTPAATNVATTNAGLTASTLSASITYPMQ